MIKIWEQFLEQLANFNGACFASDRGEEHDRGLNSPNKLSSLQNSLGCMGHCNKLFMAISSKPTEKSCCISTKTVLRFYPFKNYENMSTNLQIKYKMNLCLVLNQFFIVHTISRTIFNHVT